MAEHRRLPERPHRVLIGFLLVLIILGGHLAAPAIADPASVPRPWSFVVSGLAAATVGFSTATLTTLTYCLAFFRDVEPARNLLKWVANYAAIGAILGTLLGLRMAGPCSPAGSASRSSACSARSATPRRCSPCS